LDVTNYYKLINYGKVVVLKKKRLKPALQNIRNTKAVTEGKVIA